MRRQLFAVIAAAALFAGSAIPAGASDANTRTYEVTITNVSATQWLTPPVVATTSEDFDLFKKGRAANSDIQQLSENGNLAPLLGTLNGSSEVHSVELAFGAAGPLAPGESVTITIDADKYSDDLLVAAMLICTNDGFTAIDGKSLPDSPNDTKKFKAVAYDAGTEINTENLGDMVPPCQPLNGVSGDPGTGASNPALAEDGVIRRHRGIVGGSDLTQAAHGWNSRKPVIKVSATWVGGDDD